MTNLHLSDTDARCALCQRWIPSDTQDWFVFVKADDTVGAIHTDCQKSSASNWTLKWGTTRVTRPIHTIRPELIEAVRE